VDTGRNTVLGTTEFADMPSTGREVPPTAISLLWRHFRWRGVRLAAHLTAYPRPPSGVVRDLVELVPRFEADLRCR